MRRNATVVATTAAAMTLTSAPFHTPGRWLRAGRQLTHVWPGLRERAQGVGAENDVTASDQRLRNQPTPAAAA
jgi:hypothetical protein